MGNALEREEAHFLLVPNVSSALTTTSIDFLTAPLRLSSRRRFRQIHAYQPNLSMKPQQSPSGVEIEIATALVNLKKGDELFSDYIGKATLIDPLGAMTRASDNTSYRQYVLADNYHFVCHMCPLHVSLLEVQP